MPLTEAFRAFPDQLNLRRLMDLIIKQANCHMHVMSHLISAGDDVVPNQYGEPYNSNILKPKETY